jgi:hypothetical protein
MEKGGMCDTECMDECWKNSDDEYSCEACSCLLESEEAQVKPGSLKQRYFRNDNDDDLPEFPVPNQGDILLLL